MAGLRTLLDFPTAGGGSVNFDTLRIWNTSTTTASNGGACCLWTVPAGVTWFAVELWGGGGGGAASCCCSAGWPGGSGSYARKIISGLNGLGGQQYTLCAAGSTGCSATFCLGCAGNPSFVAVNGGAVQVCASGGTCGRGRCFFQIGCSYSGCAQQQCGSFTGTMGICGVTGSAKGNSYCSTQYWQYMPSAPFTMGGNRASMDGCSGSSNGCMGCAYGGYAYFPGGGGASAATHSDQMSCGAAGAGGMIEIYYPVIT